MDKLTSLCSMNDGYLNRSLLFFFFLVNCILARPCIRELESWMYDQMLDTGCSEHASNAQGFVYPNYQLMNSQLH